MPGRPSPRKITGRFTPPPWLLCEFNLDLKTDRILRSAKESVHTLNRRSDSRNFSPQVLGEVAHAQGKRQQKNQFQFMTNGTHAIRRKETNQYTPSYALRIPIVQLLARRPGRASCRSSPSIPSTLPILRYSRPIRRSRRRVDNRGRWDGRLGRSGGGGLRSRLRGTRGASASRLVDHCRGSRAVLDGVAAGEFTEVCMRGKVRTGRSERKSGESETYMCLQRPRRHGVVAYSCSSERRSGRSRHGSSQVARLGPCRYP